MINSKQPGQAVQILVRYNGRYIYALNGTDDDKLLGSLSDSEVAEKLLRYVLSDLAAKKDVKLVA